MPENEFEKQVRELMEKFTLTPSEAAWKKIEPRIVKEKRRRRWLVLFFVFAGLMVSGYFMYNGLNEKGTSTVNALTKNKEEKTTNKNSVAIDKKQNEDSIAVSSFADKQNVTNDIASLQNDRKISASSKRLDATGNSITKKEKEIQKSDEKKIADVTETLNNVFENKEQAGINNEKINQQKITSDIPQKEVVINSENEQQSDASHEISKEDAPLKKDTPQTTAKTEKKTSANKKWQLGFSAFYGMSDAIKNVTGSHEYSPNTQNNSIGGYYSTVPASKQVYVRSAFSLGIEVKKPVLKRASIIAGLHYAKLNTEIQTGVKKDSASSFRYNSIADAPVTRVTNFYTTGKGNNYKNYYSFIQIPVIYEQSFLKNNLLNLNAGFSLNHLLKSNALIFDEVNHAYYQNNDLLRKTQINFVGGVNVRVPLSKTIYLNAGPQFQYSLTNLSKYSKYDNRHLFSVGLQTSIFFHK